MGAGFEILLNLGLPIGIIVVALVVGLILEKRHYRSIRDREAKLGGIPLLNGKEYPRHAAIAEARLVEGSVVVSIDYFKRLLARLRNIFGGEVRSYVSLLDRGRREAILRMREQFPQADVIVNFRMETSSISQGKGNAIGSTEVHAYGTAIRFVESSEA